MTFNMQNTNNCPLRIVVVLFLICLVPMSCKNPIKKVISRYPDGTPGVIYEYSDKNDTLNFISKSYYHNGNIHKISTVVGGKFIGKPTTFYENGKISQIDSLLHRRSPDENDWDADVVTFYNNGSVSEKFKIRHGYVSGMTEFYNEKGLLVKEYYVTKDTIKNGLYKEFNGNGKVVYETTYRNDTLSDFEYYFDDNGDTLKYNAVTKEGGGTFPYKRWLKNGEILQGIFVDSSGKIAEWKWIDKNGKVLKRKLQHSVNKIFISPKDN